MIRADGASVLAVALATVVAVLLVAGVADGAGSALREPIALRCENSEVVLDVRPYQWNVDGEISFLTRVYHYQGVPMIPAPTIVMKAGKTCSLTIVNSLPTNTPVSNCAYHANFLHCPDTTNLHAHGLHVGGGQYAEDQRAHIFPGQQHTFVYDIPADHHFGTHWYHSHHHGAGALQLSGGLYGALIVEPSDTQLPTLPADLSQFYFPTANVTIDPVDGSVDTTNPNQHVMVLSHVWFGGSDRVPPTSAPFAQFDHAAWSALFASIPPEQYESLPPNAQILKGNPNIYIVNGAYQPFVVMQPDDVTLFRFVHAAQSRTLDLELTDPLRACTMTSVARDGIVQYTPYQNLTASVMSAGNRHDVAIRCGAAAVNTNITVRVFPDPARRLGLGVDNRHSQAVLFTILIRELGNPKMTTVPTSSIRPHMPAYLADLMGESPVEGALLVGTPGTIVMSGSGGGEGFNANLFEGLDGDPRLKYTDRLCLGKTYDFRYTPPNTFPGGAGVHSFHQHTNPFQVVSINGANAAAISEIMRIGEWRDTIVAFGPLGTTVRIRPMDYTGDMMVHCHIVQHQDNGMMTLFQLTTDPTQCVNTDYNPLPQPIHEYRWQNGSNNNLAHPEWTMANQLVRSEFVPLFRDGVSVMRNESYAGGPLKNPREVSNLLLNRYSTTRKTTRAVNEMHTFWGLFMVGDMSKIGTQNKFVFNPVANVPPLPNINQSVPRGDPWFDPLGTGTAVINWRRTGAAQFPPPSNPGYVQYLNGPTGILDLDSFYWPEPESRQYGATHGFGGNPRGSRIPMLRAFVGGLLNETAYYTAASFNTPDQGKHRAHFSDRLNKTPPTAMMATVFIREHNRLATAFAAKNPTWDDETLFQEARRMVIAYYQKISTREYLAPLLGEPLPPYMGYNASVQPHTGLLFAVAAFRYGHSEVGEYIKRMDRDANEVPGGDLPIRTCLYRPQASVYDAGVNGNPGLEALVFGLTFSLQGDVTLQMTDALRQMNIFGGFPVDSKFQPITTFTPQTDLGMINILRGRDMGLPTYNQVLPMFGFPRINSWSEVTSDTSMQSALAKAYAHVDDCDLWICGLAEPHVESGNVGKLFKAIIRDQLTRFRDGDRFWYENPDHFTPDEISDIYATTWTDILTRNVPAITAGGGLPTNPFYTPVRQLSTYGFPLIVDESDTSYAYTRVLQQSYLLSWTPFDDHIDFRIKTTTTGWIGIGWQSNPHTMKGADIILCSFEPSGANDGSFVIEDRFALDVGIPTLDTAAGGRDDLYNKAASQTQVPHADGTIVFTTTYTWSRAIVTGDALDKDIIRDGDTKILFAFNPTTKVPSYHGPTRSPDVVINFFPPSNLLPDSPALRGLFIALAGLGIAGCIAILAVTIYYRRNPRIINATFLFCLLIPVGAILGYVSVILNAVDQTDVLCSGKFALLSVAFVLVYGSIMIKTWRIHAIFAGMTKLRSVKITTGELAAYVLLWLCVDLAVSYGVWVGLDPIHFKYVSAGVGNDGKLLPVCESSSDAGLAVFIAYKLATLLFGAYLSVTTREIDEKFNESSALGQSIYVTLVLSVVCTLIGYGLRRSPNVILIVYSVGILFSMTFTLAAQFLPKFVAIRKDPNATGETVLGNSLPMTSTVGGGPRAGPTTNRLGTNGPAAGTISRAGGNSGTKNSDDGASGVGGTTTGGSDKRAPQPSVLSDGADAATRHGSVASTASGAVVSTTVGPDDVNVVVPKGFKRASTVFEDADGTVVSGSTAPVAGDPVPATRDTAMSVAPPPPPSE